MAQKADSANREPLTRERVVREAVAWADRDGADALTMRALATALGVVPMALYKHVANKKDLLDGMIDLVVSGIDRTVPEFGWKDGVRARILSARRALMDHRWAPAVIESRTTASGPVLDYMDSLMGLFLAGGLSSDLTHYAMHAIGSRMWGFTQEVFPTPRVPGEPGERETFLADAARRYPHIIRISTTAGGCDDQVEFEFALDLLLDGIQLRHEAGWSSRTSP